MGWDVDGDIETALGNWDSAALEMGSHGIYRAFSRGHGSSLYGVGVDIVKARVYKQFPSVSLSLYIIVLYFIALYHGRREMCTRVVVARSNDEVE